MAEHACECGICNDCRRAGVDHFTRRHVLGGLLGAATVGAAQIAVAKEPAPDPAVALKAAEAEAFQNLKGLFTAEKAYYAEYDQYVGNLDRIGFAPDDWCEDGARLRIKEKSTPFKKVGCHFIYEVETMGTAPQMQFRAYARGAVAPVLGINYLVESSGEYAGIPRRNPK